MILQQEIVLRERPRGFHLITDEIIRELSELPSVGLVNLFIQHTSCALAINENADPDVRRDMEMIFDRLVRENEPYYQHVLEGADDTPAVLAGVSLTVPITRGRLNLGRWQGIYLCEFRNDGGPRRMVVTLYG